MLSDQAELGAGGVVGDVEGERFVERRPLSSTGDVESIVFCYEPIHAATGTPPTTANGLTPARACSTHKESHAHETCQAVGDAGGGRDERRRLGVELVHHVPGDPSLEACDPLVPVQPATADPGHQHPAQARSSAEGTFRMRRRRSGGVRVRGGRGNGLQRAARLSE